MRKTALLDHIEMDEQDSAALSRKPRRVKIDPGWTWQLRLLPVEVGPDKMPYVKLAQHWINKTPYYCPRYTPRAYGGDPDAICPLCNASEDLNNSDDKFVSDLAYSIRCTLQYRTWCLVFDMEDPKGNIDEMALNEILNPYTFDMYPTTWDDYKKYQKWAASRGSRSGETPSEFGIMDLETGCNLLATHGKKGTNLEKVEAGPGPIFDVKETVWDDYITKVFKMIKEPKIIIPKQSVLDEMAEKAYERSERGENSKVSSRSSRGRGTVEESDDDVAPAGRGRSRFSGEEDDAPVRGRRSAPVDDRDGLEEEAPRTPARRGAPARQQAQPEDDYPDPTAPVAPLNRRSAPARQQEPDTDQVPDAEMPARRTRTQPAPEPDQDPADEKPPVDIAPRRGTPAAIEPAARRAAPTRPAPQPEPEQETTDGGLEAEDEKPVQPAARPATRQSIDPAPKRASQFPRDGVDEEEDNAPEEANDPAPAAREEVDDAPPSVGVTAPAPARSAPATSSTLANRLAAIHNKGR